jgi:hypothetical protein
LSNMPQPFKFIKFSKKMQKRVCIRKTSDDNLTIILKLSAR